tara:strand:+ start:984 stop:1169 length:186 start_codon:yes stop_codon:yes gene_type:complete
MNRNMNKDIFNIKDIKDFVRLLVFLVVSPVIGMVMLLGVIATSVAMICMYIRDFIMEKFYE